MTDSLRTLGGLVLLTALAVAPLYYGSTRVLPLYTLLALGSAGSLAWLISFCISGSVALPPLLPQFGVMLIVLSGAVWLFVLPLPELPAFTARHLARLAERWPYSIVPRNFGLLMVWTACGMAVWFALADYARDPAWRGAMAAVMVLSGGFVALLGLLQNATHARGIYWNSGVPMPGAFFGTFFHHTSAGAYLNSVWPLGFALALRTIRQQSETPATRAVIYGALVCSALMLAAHSGHISRLPQVIAIVALIVFTLWVGLWRVLGQVRGLRTVVGAVSAGLLIAVLAFGATRLSDIKSRWNQLNWSGLRGGATTTAAISADEWPRQMRDDLFVPSSHAGYPLGDRGAAYAAAWSAIKSHPWFGWGPGGWTAAAAAVSTDPFIRTFYLLVQFTHSDYLQTWVEWGLVGAGGWALLVPGAAINALVRLRRRPSQDFIGAAAGISLVAVLLQSSIDFPLQIPAVQFNAIALCAIAWTVPGKSVERGSSTPFLLT